MKSLLKFFVCLCVLQLFAGVPQLQAQWVEDGIGICREGNYQTGCRIASDGLGGAIIVWKDFRDGTYYKVYAQRVDANGNPQWATDGIIVCSALYNQIDPEIVTDGSGGAIITWTDYRSGTSYDMYAQRIDASGNLLWTANGIAICTASYNQDNHKIIPDGSGGAIITWRDIRNGFDYDIYAQRIDASGSVQWTADGVAICMAANSQQYPEPASDGSSGAIITWQDSRVLGSDIYAQRIDASGATQWTADGVAICTAANFQYYPKIVPASSGGAIIAWDDYRGGDGDIYAQKINVAGIVQWSANGLPVCTIAEDQSTPLLVPVSTGGAIIAWSDRRSASHFDIYAQRLDTNGYHQWASNGIAICTETQHQHLLTVISGANDNTIFIWKDYRSTSSYDLYIQKADLYGVVQWTTGGVAVTTATDDQIGAKAATDGDGGAIIAWDDEQPSAFYDIFAQRIDADGNWGIPEPVVRSVRDVPQDQGGFVNLAWDASQYDALGQITEYSIWRALDILQAAMMMQKQSCVLTSVSEIPEIITGPILRMEFLGGQQFYWELIDFHTAYYIANYSKIVPTAFDSTATSNEYHYFQIIAHTAVPTTFYVSEPDSGYSVDNLAPCPPAMLAGEQSYMPEGLQLTWGPNIESDLDNYNVYRGTDESFIPGSGNLLASPCDTLYFDGGWTWDSGYWYKVSTVDIHDNESLFAVLGPESVTGEDDPDMPQVNFLSQNYPNPFNPVTVIAFGLSEPANVRLQIYDVAGRLVRTLVDENREAGVFNETWEGLDNGGCSIASGVYFYRLIVGDFVQTRKMVLLR